MPKFQIKGETVSNICLECGVRFTTKKYIVTNISTNRSIYFYPIQYWFCSHHRNYKNFIKIKDRLYLGFKCRVCGKSFNGKDYLDNGEVCEECGKNVKKCIDCGAYFIPVRLFQKRCSNCSLIIKPSFDMWKNRPEGGGNALYVGTWRPFSCELETYLKYPDRQVDTITLRKKSDASINVISDELRGRTEYNLGPYQGDLGLKILYENVKLIRKNGWRANWSCGLHFHFDITGHGGKAEKINKLFCKFQNMLFGLTNPMRTIEGRYCGKNEPSYDMFDDRYRALNFCSIKEHNTIEYRLFAGSTNPTRVMYTAILLGQFTEWLIANYNCHDKINEVTWNEIFTNIPDNFIKYWIAVQNIQIKKWEEIGKEFPYQKFIETHRGI